MNLKYNIRMICGKLEYELGRSHVFIGYFLYDFFIKFGWHKDRYTQAVAKSFLGNVIL